MMKMICNGIYNEIIFDGIANVKKIINLQSTRTVLKIIVEKIETITILI